MDVPVQQLIKRADEALRKRSSWHSYWDDLAYVHIPRLLGFSVTREKGEEYEDLFDGTPMHAARGLANSIGGLLRPDGEKWVKMKAAEEDINDDYEAQVWLETNSERMRMAMENPKSRMRQCTGEVDLMLVVFGTGPFWVGENKERNGLMFNAIPLIDTAIEWDESGARSMFRTQKLTAKQAGNKFGIKNLGKLAIEALKTDNNTTKYTYINVVMPRSDAGRFKSRMPFASIWIEKESVHMVSQGGYLEFPYIVPRMETSPGEDWGRGPGSISLPDANTLQAMGETILTAGQRAADPPIFAPNDGSFSAANTFPGGISYYDAEAAVSLGRNPIWAMDTSYNLPITRDMQRDTREQVFASFFRNILNLPVSGPQMTATEIMSRQKEMERELSPMFGRLESDYTAPMVERVFPIMMRAGAFTPVPESLAGQDILFEYESPVKRLRQMIEVEAMRALKGEVIEIAGIDPSVMDVFDSGVYVEEMGKALRTNSQLLRDPKQVELIRLQRAQKEEMQQQAAMAESVAGIAKTGAEAAETAGMIE